MLILYKVVISKEHHKKTLFFSTAEEVSVFEDFINKNFTTINIKKQTITVPYINNNAKALIQMYKEEKDLWN